MTHADAVVIGGGIVGAACADALSGERLRVVLLEAGQIGGCATGAGMGHIVAMDDSEAQFALTSYSARLWRQLRSELPHNVEYEDRGTLWVAADERELEAVHARRGFYSHRGVACDVLDTRQLAAAEPQLRHGLAGALLVPGDSVVYAPCAAQWLAARARRHGAQIHVGVAAEALEADAVQLSGGGRIAAGMVILAGGIASAQLLAPGLPLRPRKGHLAITDRYPGLLHHQLVELGYLTSAHGHDNESVACNLQPRATGQILIGSSRQYGVESGGVERHMLQRMLQRAVEYMPALERLDVIRCWTGFRAATPDSLPLIGPHPRYPRLYLATGHEGLGITTSLATARLLTDHALERTPAIPPEPYLPARFAELAAA